MFGGAGAVLLVSTFAGVATCASIDLERPAPGAVVQLGPPKPTPAPPAPPTCCACQNSVNPGKVAFYDKRGTCARCVVPQWKAFEYTGPKPSIFSNKHHAHCIKFTLSEIGKHEKQRERVRVEMEKDGCRLKRGGGLRWDKAQKDLQALEKTLTRDAPYYGWVYGMHEDGHLLVYRPEARASPASRVDTSRIAVGKKSWVAVVALRGRVYAVPYNARKLLVFDPASGQLSDFDTSHVADGDRKWRSAVAVGGKVYGVPYDAKQLLIYNPANGDVRGVDTSEAEDGDCKGKWGGAVAFDNKLYAVPFNAKAVLVYYSQTGDVSSIPTSHVETGRRKWSGAVAYGGVVYGVPFNAKKLLVVKPFLPLINRAVSKADGADISEHEEKVFGKWAGAVALDGKLYVVPYNAKNLLVSEFVQGDSLCRGCDLGNITEVDSSSAGISEHRKWAGAVAMNGQVLGLPADAGRVLMYRPGTPTVEGKEVNGVGDGSWTAAVALTGSVPPLVCE